MRDGSGTPSVFFGAGETYRADTCEPLKRAARLGEVSLSALGRGAYPGKHTLPDTLPEILSLGVWDAPTRQNWGLDWHRNEGIELTMVTRGHVPFAVDGRPHPMQRGDLSVTRPWQAHRVGDPFLPANRLHWIILDLDVRRPHERWKWPEWFVLPQDNMRRLTDLLQHNEEPVWRVTPRIEESFQRLTALIGEDTVATLEARLALAVNELFLDLLELLEHHTIPLDRYLSSTRRTVEMTLQRVRNTSSHPWTLEEMAAAAGLGRSRFSYYCRIVSGLTPVAFLNRTRVDAARDLLARDPARSITDVSETCGFESSQYFARVFRKLTGRTAREYRAAASETAAGAPADSASTPRREPSGTRSSS